MPGFGYKFPSTRPKAAIRVYVGKSQGFATIRNMELGFFFYRTYIFFISHKFNKNYRIAFIILNTIIEVIIMINPYFFHN